MSDTTCIKKKQWAPQIREQLKALVSTADLICYRGSFICQLIKYVPFFPLKSSLNRILCLRMSRQNWTIGHVNVHRLKGGFLTVLEISPWRSLHFMELEMALPAMYYLLQKSMHAQDLLLTATHMYMYRYMHTYVSFILHAGTKELIVGVDRGVSAHNLILRYQ